MRNIELYDAIVSEDIKKTKKIIPSIHPSDIAEVINHLSPDDKIKLFSLLDTDIASDVILEVDDYSLEILLDALTTEKISELAAVMDVDDATDLVEELPIEERNAVLRSLKRREKIKELLKHPETSAGGKMRTDILTVNEKESIASVLKKMRKFGKKDFNYVFVVDDEGKYKGAISPWDVLISSPYKKVKSILQFTPTVNVNDDQEYVVNVVKKYDLVEVPVVDNNGVLKGIITVDDIMDVMEEEATEDILRMGGVSEEEEAFTPPFRAVKMRLLWLYINLGTAFLAAAVVGAFQNTIKSFIALAVFMPIVAGMGGNAGTQTLTVIVRSLALGEVKLRDVWRMLGKEFLIGFSTGAGVGILTSIIAYVWKGNVLFGLVVGLALIINHIIAGIMGVIIPLTLKKFKIDPAHASSIFLTTFTDVIGFFALLGLAKIILR